MCTCDGARDRKNLCACICVFEHVPARRVLFLTASDLEVCDSELQ